MTEKIVALSLNGQAVIQSDFNNVAEEAARASDWMLWELLRTPPTVTVNAPLKYVLPSGGPKNGGASDMERGSIVRSSQSANASVKVYPFTVVIGSRSGLAGGVIAGLRDIRTATFFGTDAIPAALAILQIPASAGGYRWDLLWARVDIDQPDSPVNRYVKDGAGQATSQVVSVSSSTTVTLGRTQGAEVGAGLAARPSLPADSANTYYVPLAYVGVSAAHTLITQIPGFRIHEVAPCIQLGQAHGVSSMRVPNSCWLPNGATVVNEGEAANGSGAPSYLPSTMQGGITLAPIPLRMSDTGSANIPPNAFTVIDDSVDWTKRVFKLSLSMIVGGTLQAMPWYSAAAPAAQPFYQQLGPVPLVVFGANSFSDRTAPAGVPFIDSFTGISTGGYTLLALDSSTTPALAAGAKFALLVDATGKLYAWRNGVNAVREAILWLEATARFPNNDLSSL